MRKPNKRMGNVITRVLGMYKAVGKTLDQDDVSKLNREDRRRLKVLIKRRKEHIMVYGKLSDVNLEKSNR
jgi:hypothetical protein